MTTLQGKRKRERQNTKPGDKRMQSDRQIRVVCCPGRNRHEERHELREGERRYYPYPSA